MKIFNTNIKKTLFYNLIIFDFILLESSSKKISNFFLEKLQNEKFITTRISIFPIVKNFKRFIRLLQFTKNTTLEVSKFKKSNISLNGSKKNLINFFYLWVNSEHSLELLKILFQQYKLSCFVKLNLFFPFSNPRSTLKVGLIFDQFINLRNFFSFFFKKFYFLHAFNSFEDSVHFTFYKIFSDLDDYKKLLFLGLIFISIFKK